MEKEPKSTHARHPAGGAVQQQGADLRNPSRVQRPGNAPVAAATGGCGGNADRIIAAVRDGLEELRLAIADQARQQQKFFEDALNQRHEEVLNALSEVHPEIQDVGDELEDESDAEEDEDDS